MNRRASPIIASERHHMIEVAAYLRAEQRSFSPGHELADWLEAETEVDRRIAAAAPPAPQPREEEHFADLQESEPRSIAKQERLKRLVRRSPQRDEPRVDSVPPEERRG